MGVGVVYEAEEDGEGLFHVGEAWGMVGLGHLFLLGEGRLRWPPFYLASNPRNTSSRLSLSRYRALHGCHCSVLHVWQDVRIGVHRLRDRSVSENLLHDLGVDVLREQERSGVQERSCMHPGVPHVFDERLRYARRVAARLLHQSPRACRHHLLLFSFYLQNGRFSKWTRGDSNP
jgi:hypothetical protein